MCIYVYVIICFCFCCNFYVVVIIATWGGVGSDKNVVYTTSDEIYMRPKYTNPNFTKSMDSF